MADEPIVRKTSTVNELPENSTIASVAMQRRLPRYSMWALLSFVTFVCLALVLYRAIGPMAAQVAVWCAAAIAIARWNRGAPELLVGLSFVAQTVVVLLMCFAEVHFDVGPGLDGPGLVADYFIFLVAGMVVSFRRTYFMPRAVLAQVAISIAHLLLVLSFA
jgi:hypothetical protein